MQAIAHASEEDCSSSDCGFIGPVCALLALASYGCAHQALVDFATSLKGIEQSKFLNCSGASMLELSEAGQDRVSFVATLKAGNVIGTASPAVMPEASCLVDAEVQNDRLVNATFSGNQSTCGVVFGPCLQEQERCCGRARSKLVP